MRITPPPPARQPTKENPTEVGVSPGILPGRRRPLIELLLMGYRPYKTAPARFEFWPTCYGGLCSADLIPLSHAARWDYNVNFWHGSVFPFYKTGGALLFYQSARGAEVRPALASWANAATAIRLRGKGWTSFSGTANPVKQAPLPERAGLLYGSAPDPATRRPLLERAGLPYGSADAAPTQS